MRATTFHTFIFSIKRCDIILIPDVVADSAEMRWKNIKGYYYIK